MDLNLIFTSDFCVRGLGAESSFSGDSAFCLYSPDGRSLFFRARSLDWAAVEIGASIEYKPGESIRALQVLGQGEGLVVTSTFRIFRLEISDFCGGKAEFSAVEFRCAAGIPKNSRVRLLQNGAETFLVAGHMVFGLSGVAGRFSLVKVLGEEAVDAVKVESGLLVATSRKIVALLPKANEKGWSCESRVLLQLPGGIKGVAAAEGKVFALTTEGLFECGAQGEIKGSSEALKGGLENAEGRLVLPTEAFGPESPRWVAAVGASLVVLGEQFAQVLGSPSRPPLYALPISHFAFVEAGGRVFALGAEPSLTLSVAQLGAVSVPKDEMVQRFVERRLDERLSLVFAFLAMKFFESRDSLGRNPNGIVQNLLEELNLSADLIRHPRFRPNSIRFFKLVKSFLPSEVRTLSKKYTIEGPLNPPLKSREPLATLPDENAEVGGNRPVQTLKTTRSLSHRACSQEKEKRSSNNSQTFCLPIQGDREPIASESN